MSLPPLCPSSLFRLNNDGPFPCLLVHQNSFLFFFARHVFSFPSLGVICNAHPRVDEMFDSAESAGDHILSQNARLTCLPLPPPFMVCAPVSTLSCQNHHGVPPSSSLELVAPFLSSAVPPLSPPHINDLRRITFD